MPQVFHARVDWGAGRLKLYVRLSAGFKPDGTTVAAANAAAQKEYSSKLADSAKAILELEAEAKEQATARFHYLARKAPREPERFAGLLIMFIMAALAASVCSAIATLAVLH